MHSLWGSEILEFKTSPDYITKFLSKKQKLQNKTKKVSNKNRQSYIIITLSEIGNLDLIMKTLMSQFFKRGSSIYDLIFLSPNFI